MLINNMVKPNNETWLKYKFNSNKKTISREKSCQLIKRAFLEK